jgi:hypothetical protein
VSILSHIRTWALLAVAVTTASLIFFAHRLIGWLAAADWCGRAVHASREGERPESAITGCYGLMTRQIDALALNSHLAIGVLALCLLVLIVIVLAGGRLSFKANKDGVETEIGATATPSKSRMPL